MFLEKEKRNRSTRTQQREQHIGHIGYPISVFTFFELVFWVSLLLVSVVSSVVTCGVVRS